jgi:hypothetical protein
MLNDEIKKYKPKKNFNFSNLMTMVIRSETLYIEKLRNSIPANQILKNKLKKNQLHNKI